MALTNVVSGPVPTVACWVALQARHRQPAQPRCPPLSRGPADRPHFRCLASAQTVITSYYIHMDPAYSDMPAASIGRSPRSDAGHPVSDQADISGQPLDHPTNPASMEAGLRHKGSCSRSTPPEQYKYCIQIRTNVLYLHRYSTHTVWQLIYSRYTVPRYTVTTDSGYIHCMN